MEQHLPEIVTAITSLALVAAGYGALQQRVKNIEARLSQCERYRERMSDSIEKRLDAIERHLAHIDGKLDRPMVQG